MEWNCKSQKKKPKTKTTEDEKESKEQHIIILLALVFASSASNGNCSGTLVVDLFNGNNQIEKRLPRKATHSFIKYSKFLSFS